MERHSRNQASLRILDRYLLHELGVPFALSLGILTFILLTREILRLVELLINKGVGFLPLLKTFSLLLPSFFVLTLPIACLIASISAFSRLSSDRELTAMHASGIATGRLLRPMFLFVVPILAVTLFLAQYAQPWSGPSVKKSALLMLRGDVSLSLDEGVFNTPTANVVMYVGDSDADGGSPGVFISDTRTKDEPRIIVAREWALINDPLHSRIGMKLRDGAIHIRPKDPSQYQMLRFSSYDFTIELGDSLAPLMEQRPSIFEIRYQLSQSGGKDPKYRKLLEEEYKNFAFPFATVVFGLIGMPLGIVAKRSGKAGGFALGILIVLSFYLLNVMADFWVSRRLMTPFLGAWFPNMIFAAIVILLFRRRATLR
jgi:lipopolysaccharide export system permease protein